MFSGDEHQEYLEAQVAVASKKSPQTRIINLNDGRWIALATQPVADGGWVVTHADITGRKAAEDEVKKHRDHLQELVDQATMDLKSQAEILENALAKEKELNELQRQFVSMASHEFRTPLAIIDSTAQRLKKRADGMSSEEALSRIDKIRSAVQRMVRLMESTLSVARMEEGAISIDLKPCDISEIISESCLRMQEISKNHTIRHDLSEMPPLIIADHDAVEQILTNLISNAVKYSPGSPDVDVEAFSDDGDVIISVKDNGLGIDEDDIPKMFTRFFRARSSTGIAGTGIGLGSGPIKRIPSALVL